LNAIAPDHHDPQEATTPDTTPPATSAQPPEVEQLRARVNRLEILLAATRRAYADLTAAAHTALVAAVNDEPDPLRRLRDELCPPPELAAPPPSAPAGGRW